MKIESPAAPWLRIGVTGGIACGKSLVGGYLREMGVAVIEADDVCHDLMRAHTALFERIVAEFGREILAPDGAINRAELGRRVFGNPAALSSLNAIVHPAARDAISVWLRAQRGSQHGAWRAGAVAIIPLLYESGWEADWDRVICVGAPLNLQKERLRSKGFTEDELSARLAAQWPVEQKIRRADYVIFNSGSHSCAQMQTVQVLQQIGKHVEKSDG